MFYPALLLFAGLARAQTWCGKHYMKSQSPSEPGGEFPTPATSPDPLLAFRCAPAVRPYLPADANSPSDPTFVAILVDTPRTHLHIANAAPISLPSSSSGSGLLTVTISANGRSIASGSVPLNATKHPLTFDLAASGLQPRTQAYSLSCSATLSSSQQHFSATGSLSYLPNPPTTIGSVTKMDLRTGALLARPANGNGGPYQPVFPIGFYTQFGSYLARNLSALDQLAAQGFNIIHIVPPLDDTPTLDRVIDRMQQLGLYLMYDMRSSYMNTTSVTAQVNHIKSRPNLLLWYTADEPDGTSDPLDATLKSSNLITSLDGGDGISGAGYHPVSLVLNCQDYHFTEYTTGCDIVLQDTYMVGNNVTFSSVWGTPCTRTYGDCGCDNCQGSFEDISTRMDQFRDRLFINGWDRTKAVWTVPQGFGNETYWKRFPTGKEFIVETVLGINHGAMGSISWDDPTSTDIKSSASAFALALPALTPFILNPTATFRQLTLPNRVDLGLWTVPATRRTLVLGTNMNSAIMTVSLSQLGLPATGDGHGITQVFEGGAFLDPARNRFEFQSLGTGAWVVVSE